MILHTIILGIIEGLTEFIPISSTAHLLLAGNVLGMPADEFLQALSICIQSGAILAAVFYFWHVVWRDRSLIGKVIVGFIPTGIAGVLLYPLIKSAFASTAIIGSALVIGGIALILIRPIDEITTPKDITYKQSIWIGLMQVAAFIPGVSRSGATLIGGTLVRIPRQTIVTFSFLLAIPTILGATVVEAAKMPDLSGSQWALIVLGTVVAFITALFTIKFFIKLLTEKPLAWFGWYRIALGLLVLIFLQ